MIPLPHLPFTQRSDRPRGHSTTDDLAAAHGLSRHRCACLRSLHCRLQNIRGGKQWPFSRRLLTEGREVIVQPRLWDLISTEEPPVRVDGATRSELLALMAHMLVVVFQAEGGKANDRVSAPSQDQAGAPGAQSHRLPPAIHRQTGAAEQGKPASTV